MINELSILIPTYNCSCVELVRQLAVQTGYAPDLRWEIIVADDGSTDEELMNANDAINGIEHCRYIRRGFNSGRAAIRNFLGKQAHYKWLLFIDGDMSVVNNRYLYIYRKARGPICYGGYTVIGDSKKLKNNLRFQYEKHALRAHSAKNRRKRPNLDFHTSNFLINRQIFMDFPLDESYKEYGYEDVAYGKFLGDHSIIIQHIDNPVGFYRFESNEDFILKTKEGLRTLKKHQKELRQVSRIIRAADSLHSWHLDKIALKAYNKHEEELWSRLAKRPSLFLFSLGKLGYYIKS